MSVDPEALAADLADEAAELIDLVREAEAPLDTPTPAPGWDIGDQLTHLAYFDEVAVVAIADPERFRTMRDESLIDVQQRVDEALGTGKGRTTDDLIDWFGSSRSDLAGVVATSDPRTRVPWFGPDMTVASKATARIMETWAHGHDIAEALGVQRRPTRRLRHVAHIGVRALPNSFAAHGLDVPPEPVAVELVGPDGEPWHWPAPEATNKVSGPALDFCLVVTQRRHIDDTDLVPTGAVAQAWMQVAQAFAGPPGAGPKRLG